MSENRNKNSNWNFGIMAAAAVAATGVAYYLGYKSGNQTCQEQMLEQHSTVSNDAHATSRCKNHEECAICLKKMKPVQRLNCGHNYHQECISEWLPISPTCPLCRESQE